MFTIWSTPIFAIFISKHLCHIVTLVSVLNAVDNEATMSRVTSLELCRVANFSPLIFFDRYPAHPRSHEYIV